MLESKKYPDIDFQLEFEEMIARVVGVGIAYYAPRFMRCECVVVVLCANEISEDMLYCILEWETRIVHETAYNANCMRYVWPRHDHSVHQGTNSRCVMYRLHMIPLRTGCQCVLCYRVLHRVTS